MEETKLVQLEEQLWSANDAYKISILNNLASYCRTKYPGKALSYALKAQELSEKFTDLKNNSDSLNIIAYIYATSINDIGKAREYADRALETSRKIKYRKGRAASYLTKTIVYTKVGNHLKALKGLSKSLNIYSDLDDRIGIARVYNRLGISYQALGNIEKSFDYFTKAKEFFEEIGDTHSIAEELNNLGLLFTQQGEIEKAFCLFNQAKTLFEDSGSSIATVLLNISKIHKLREEYTEAKKIIHQVLALATENNDQYIIASANLRIGILNKKIGVNESSLPYYQKALKIASELKNRDLEKEICLTISQFFEEKNDFKKALEYHKRNYNLEKKEKDSIILSTMSFSGNVTSKESEIYRVRNRELLKINAKLKRSNKKIRYRAEKCRKMSRIDFLTNLFNRQHLDTVLEREWNRAVRYGHPLSVAMVDVDLFKRVNDNYNHHVGDIVLKSISSILQENIRTCDIIGRYGGEEFLAIFPDTSIEGAKVACEKMRGAVESFSWDSICPQLKITISIGICSRGPAMEKAQDIVLKADQNMYQAKNSGRNKVIP